MIRRMKPNEHLIFCASAGFVPKRSEKLRFVIYFTSLNKYVERLVHAFLFSDQVAHIIKSNTTHMACVDLHSGYFLVKLYFTFLESLPVFIVML